MKTTDVKNELITISKNEIAGETVNSVDARNLHGKLGVGKVFANWIKGKIEKYGFVEGIDFLPKVEKTNGRPKTDYILTLDTAKEIAMVENNDKGREIRRYFIEIEKKLREEPQYNDMLPSEMMRQAANLMAKASLDTRKLEQATVDYVKENRQLKANNNKHKALQSNISEMGRAEVMMSVEEASVELGKTRNLLFKMMRFENFLKKNNAPYKRFDGKYFIQKTVRHLTKGGNYASYKQTFVTPKGLSLLKSTFA